MSDVGSLPIAPKMVRNHVALPLLKKGEGVKEEGVRLAEVHNHRTLACSTGMASMWKIKT